MTEKLDADVDERRLGDGRAAVGPNDLNRRVDTWRAGGEHRGRDILPREKRSGVGAVGPDRWVRSHPVDRGPEVTPMLRIARHRYVDIVEVPQGILEAAGRRHSLLPGCHWLTDS